MKRISIDPITRLEGHGKIDIFLADDGSVANCYFQVPELRRRILFTLSLFVVYRFGEHMPSLGVGTSITALRAATGQRRAPPRWA